MGKKSKKKQSKGRPRTQVVAVAPPRSYATFEGAAFVVLLTLLVLFQGGFFSDASSAIGVLGIMCVGISLAIRIVKKTLPSARELAQRALVVLLFVGIGIFGLISAAVNGVFVQSSMEALPWITAAVIGFLVVPLSSKERAWTLRGLAWVAAVLGCLGVLMMAGGVPLVGLVQANRLQFSFQYANAAALWFAVSAVIIWAVSSRQEESTPAAQTNWLELSALFPLASLMLTRSVGALIVFALGLVVLLAWWLRKGFWTKAILAAVQVGFSMLVLLVGRFVGFEWSLPAAVILFACLLPIQKSFQKGSLAEKGSASGGITFAIVAACVVLFAVVGLLFGRTDQAFLTFAERLVQMQDGLTVLAASVVLGVGPDQWAVLYPAIQSAAYDANSIHCSYLQVALDSGVLGLACLVAALVVGIVRAAKARNMVLLICIGMMALHAVFDLDLQFVALVVLLEFLLLLPLGSDRSPARNA